MPSSERLLALDQNHAVYCDIVSSQAVDLQGNSSSRLTEDFLPGVNRRLKRAEFLRKKIPGSKTNNYFGFRVPAILNQCGCISSIDTGIRRSVVRGEDWQVEVGHHKDEND